MCRYFAALHNIIRRQKTNIYDMLPTTMRAVVLPAVHAPVELREIPMPAALALNQALVRVRAAALNHRDVYITQGLYPAITTPVVLGSDAVGEVVAVGDTTAHGVWLHQRVVLNPNNQWGENPAAQSAFYHVLGMPTQGTLAEYICVHVDRLQPAPQHLSDEQAASLPLAGLTAYRALMGRAALQQGERVLISGIGGGVALFALQFAVAAGAEVWVTSSSEAKIERAQQLGAKGGANYRQADWHKQLLQAADGGFDVVIDSAGGSGFEKFIDIANPGGRIAFYGGTHGKFTVNPQKAFWKQLSILGSTMGTDAEFEQMLRMVNECSIVPMVDSVFGFEQAAAAFERMRLGEQMGKIVVRVTSDEWA